MQPIAFVTGADRGLGFALCEGLLARGWRVFGGRYMPDWPDLAALAERFPEMLHAVPLDVTSVESTRAAARAVAGMAERVDLLINNAGVISPAVERAVGEGLDYPEAHREFDVNALGALRVVEAFLPLTDRGKMKRLCFVSSEAGSITRCERQAWYGYCMSKAALNMAIKITFNRLRPEGYTFRVYHPGWMRSYMHGSKNMEADLEPEAAAAMALHFFLEEREDEDDLALIDYQGQAWPW
ncbi:MAG: SDR family NAD(P)-dependent oxidoreductase [Anaerolineae bacterium]|nr:SDR family NAD(P)-dependent oxidoreductase [Anaerolineae bacterium]